MSNKLMLLTICIVGFLAVSAVSAQDNSTCIENTQDNILTSQIDTKEIISTDEGCSAICENESLTDDIENPEAFIYAPSKIYYCYQKDYDDYGYDSSIIYGSNNHFEGYLKIYAGNNLVSSHFYNDSDDFQTDSFFTLIGGKKLSLDSYNLKMEDMNGTVWASKSLNVVKNPTRLGFTSFKESIEYSSETLYRYILDGDGYSVSDAKGFVILTIGGKQYSATVKSGKYVLTFKIPSKAKTYVCKVTYTGDAKYQSSSNAFKLIIYKPAVKLYASNKAYKVKSTKLYVAVLKDNRGKAMKNTKVSLIVKGKVYNAVTSSHGKAIFKILNLNKRGTVNAIVKYAGSATYKSAIKTVRFTVR